MQRRILKNERTNEWMDGYLVECEMLMNAKE